MGPKMNNGRFTALYKFVDDLSKAPLLLCGILVVTTLLLYAPVAHYDFIGLDDTAYIAKNAHVHTGLNLANITWAFTSFFAGNWNPIAWLSHMVDCQLFGQNSGAHHCVNLVLHIANVLLLFTLLRLGTGAVWRSFLVAILFAVHPLNVETVAWIAERKSLLSALFSFLTIAAYGWYVQRPSWNRYLAILGAFSLALMSKPMAVTLPLVLLLIDYWPLNRLQELPFRRKWVLLFTEKLPLFLMSIASSCITMSAQRTTGNLTSLSVLPLQIRLENVVHSYVEYIGKLFWPSELAVLYPIAGARGASLPAVEVIASAVVLTGLTAAVLYFYRTRYLAMGWFLFLVVLVPVIGFVQFHQVAIADRFTYIPFVGLFILLVWGISSVADKISMNRVVQAFASLCVLCVIVAFAAASSHYLQYWKNEITLLTQARNVAAQPDPLIELALADGLTAAGRDDEALTHYQQACTLDYSNTLCHYNSARILFAKNEFGKAIEECHIVAHLADTHLADTRAMAHSVDCYIASGSVMMNYGKYKAAEREFDAALAINPNDQTALHLREENLRLIKDGNQ